MMTLVIGGAASGKSEFAESLTYGYQGPKYYLATMAQRDAESQLRIERHQRIRAEKGFETIECPVDLASVVLPKRGCVLLECIGTLTANEMFAENGVKFKIDEVILRGITHLQKSAECLIVVTNDVGGDGNQYDKETRDYLRVIGAINRKIAASADEVFEVVCGIAKPLKKGTPCCF